MKGKIAINNPTYVDVVPGMILKQNLLYSSALWFIDDNFYFRRLQSNGSIGLAMSKVADYNFSTDKWEIVIDPRNNRG